MPSSAATVMNCGSLQHVSSTRRPKEESAPVIPKCFMQKMRVTLRPQDGRGVDERWSDSRPVSCQDNPAMHWAVSRVKPSAARYHSRQTFCEALVLHNQVFARHIALTLSVLFSFLTILYILSIYHFGLFTYVITSYVGWAHQTYFHWWCCSQSLEVSRGLAIRSA
jgi:hypothetical protein